MAKHLHASLFLCMNASKLNHVSLNEYCVTMYQVLYSSLHINNSVDIQFIIMQDLKEENTSAIKHQKKEIKKLGIWLDHSSAHFIIHQDNTAETASITSDFTHEVKEESLSKSENIMHNKEQQQAHEYYKKIAEVIKEYDEVLLFGPTDAKAELANILKADHHFDKIKIEVKTADKMSDNQQHAFVKEYFQ